MDFNNALGTTVQGVSDTEHQGMPARKIEGSRVYATDSRDLWDALTNAERLPRWFLPVQGDLKLGGRYQLEGNAEGEITRCDPPDELEVTWEFAGNVSWVNVQLAPEDDGVRLTLVHTMLKDEASEQHWATYGPGATGVGWDQGFLGLGLHLASGGEQVDNEAYFAWLATDAGKTFLHACAATWGKAHVEAGEDEAVARAMAEKTARFYTGA